MGVIVDDVAGGDVMDAVKAMREKLGLPQEIRPGNYQSVTELVLETAGKKAAAPAFTALGHTISYQELVARARQFASYLEHHTPLEPGDRIAIQLPNLLQYPVVTLGALLAGLVIVNTNPLYTEREIEHQFNDSGARALVVLANVAETAASVVARTSIETVIVTQLADFHPPLKRFVINNVARYIKGMVPAFEFKNQISLNRAMGLGAGGNFTPVPCQTSDLAVLQYTGGTTGVAKGAMLSHGNLLANALQAKALIDSFAMDTGDETLVLPLPLYHIYAFIMSVIMMESGNHTLLIPNPRDLDGFIKTLSKTRFTAFAGLNTLFAGMAAHPDIGAVDFSSLKMTLSGGMALNTAVAERWQQLTGCEVYEGYGLTETSPIVSTSPLGANQQGTIGLAVPSTEVKVVGEDGVALGIDQPGELCVRGPQVMLGYWQRVEATREVLDDEGWLRTGDVALIQPDGYMKIVDRKKDMILVSGFNVFPNEVEDVLMTHPGVAEAAVIGIPDEKTGETIKAFLVASGAGIELGEIKAWCQENLAGYKVPRQFELREELPKSNVGKILRRELRDQD